MNTAASLNDDDLAKVSPDEIRQTINRISGSKYFVHAPKKQRFVQVICDYYLQGRADELNEYLIGCEVFDKGVDFQPSSDPVVRVGAHDVRKKLEKYYQNEGADDPVRLDIPIGSYVPTFTRVTVPIKAERPQINLVRTDPQNADQNNPLESKGEQLSSSPTQNGLQRLIRSMLVGLLERKRSARIVTISIAGFALLMTAAIIWLFVQNRSLQQLAAVSQPDKQKVSEVWVPIQNNPNPLLIILSNPIVFRSANGADPEVLTRYGLALNKEQENFIANASGNRLPISHSQPMQLVPAINMYTGIGEAVGAYQISKMLKDWGKVTMLKQSRSIGLDDLKNYDIVLLGSVYSNQWSKPISIKENFVFSDHASIENRSPREGEEREYISRFDQRTGDLLEDYALITVVPGVSANNLIMSLAGLYSEGTQAAAEFVTDANHLAELTRQLEQMNNTKPRYYQALIKVRVENSFPTHISLLTVRALTVSE